MLARTSSGEPLCEIGWLVVPGTQWGKVKQERNSRKPLASTTLAALGHHAGILIVRFDNDPRHNLTDRGIGTAINEPFSIMPTNRWGVRSTSTSGA